MLIKKAEISDKDAVLGLLDEFRTDCMEQVTGEHAESYSARNSGVRMYEAVLARDDYCLLLLMDPDKRPVGIITGYLCPMLRNGDVRAEVEEMYVRKEFRGNDNARMLMDSFIAWCKNKRVVKVNIESENQLGRAHGFYRKYGFEVKAQRFVKKIG